jgi:tyrosinase
MSEKFSTPPFSRRRFLAGTATAALASALPRDLLFAQPAPKAAKFHRLNLSDPKAAPMLASYQKAITAMLALPPTDPRNWYRNSFTHLLDCPHGNWWFFVWHRGYLGWFEETCRQLSGDPNFALPYWDWTVEPRVPASFFTGVLNPSNPAYIASFTAFKSTFTAPVNAFWKSLTPMQVKELQLRGFNSVADFWSAVPGMFFPPSQVRSLTQANPNFDTVTKKAVSLPTVLAGLQPKTFLDFGSAKAANHSQSTGFGIVEGQPHNNVHNNIGGFMGDFLSPVDPLFFMHHSNIDRLWDVWTRKQLKLHLPTLPTGADLTAWSREPFLFYIDAAGKPVGQNKAGDYATIGQFNYDYQPGSGESVVPKLAAALAAQSAKLFTATVQSSALVFSKRATSVVKVPADVLNQASTEQGPTLFARVTIQPPADARNLRFEVFVNAPEGAEVGPDDPHFAGSFEFFGSHHHLEGPVTFDMPLSPALRGMRSANLLKAEAPLQIHVVPRAKGAAPKALAPTVRVQNLVVGTF